MTEEFDAESNLPVDDRRQFDRSRLIVDVFFDGADGTAVASTKDISPGGLYMNTQTELPEGGLLTLRLPFAEGDVIVNAEVLQQSRSRRGRAVSWSVGKRSRDYGTRSPES